MRKFETLTYSIDEANGIPDNLLNVMINFLSQWKQGFVLNEQQLSWTNVDAGVPQSSILEPVFFLNYINDLSDSWTSNPKLFADDISLFSVVQNINIASKRFKQ